MEILLCSNADHKVYSRFVKRVYKGFPNHRDCSSPVLNMFLNKKGDFCKNACIMPFMVKKYDFIVAVCIYIIHSNYSDVLQIAFFEALEGQQEAVDLIVGKAKEICAEKGLNKIVVGLNGHVNYGIGFLCDKYDTDVSFGSSFNPPYYIDYFLKYNPMQHKMVSFSGSMDSVRFERENRILERISGRFNYREISFRNFKGDMKIYTDLNNKCFKEHPFYFERTYEEDYELFCDLKYFIKEENIIFVQNGEKPIGYMLWYPDYNELLGRGETIGVRAYIKNKIFQSKVKKLKLVEIAVLPEYQKSGAVLGLFNECYKRVLSRYNSYETSWIFEDNFKSRNFGVKWAEDEYKHYVVFELSPLEEL